MGTGKPNNVEELPTIGWHEEEKVSDGDLLQRFVAQRDESAFANLVHRYGSLVLGVCQRVLGDRHQAEDAFQATFLVLIRRAGSLDRRGPLGNWLYAVAYRTATKARMTAARRRARERQAMDSTPQAYTVDEQAWNELRPILDEELSQLPGKYRAPLVLCYLEGKTQQEAAQELGWPSGSMSRRMNRARQLLRDRLQKRGVATSVGIGVLFWLLPQKANAAVVSPALVQATVKAALALGTAEGIMSTLATSEHVNDELPNIASEHSQPANHQSPAHRATESAKRARKKVAYLLLATILLLGLVGGVSAAWVYSYAQNRATPDGSDETGLEPGTGDEQDPRLSPGPAPLDFTSCHK
jgi:RNA polymerase sigma factor (sigma-70 family)